MTVRFLRDPMSLAGLGVILLVFVLTMAAPLLSPHDPLPVSLAERLQPAGNDYPLGTDPLGRCLLSRLLFGGRMTLQYSLSVLLIIILIGVPAGLAAGYLGGIVDSILMRMADIVLAFPNLILALVVTGVLGPGLINILIALALVSWVQYARVVRGMVLSLKEKEFILAARASGTAPGGIIWHHLLPNVLPPVAVMATLNLGSLVLSISTLSFLGLGAQPPLPEWGAMINEARNYIVTQPQLMLYPGTAIAVTVLGFNLLGDGLRDVFDPQGFTRPRAYGFGKGKQPVFVAGAKRIK